MTLEGVQHGGRGSSVPRVGLGVALARPNDDRALVALLGEDELRCEPNEGVVTEVGRGGSTELVDGGAGAEPLVELRDGEVAVTS